MYKHVPVWSSQYKAPVFCCYSSPFNQIRLIKRKPNHVLISIRKKFLSFSSPASRNTDMKFVSPFFFFLKRDGRILTGNNAVMALVAKSAPAGLPHLVGHGAAARRRPH